MVIKEHNGLKGLLEKLVEGAIVEEALTEIEIVNERRDICCSCKYMSAEGNPTCTICKCLLVVKTKSKVNFNVGKGVSEITHCPNNYWTDIYSRFYHDSIQRKPQ